MKYLSKMDSKEKVLANTKTTDVVTLIRKAKLEQKKQKIQSFYIAAAALSALVISGIIITH